MQQLPPAFNQTTDRGQNTISINETLNAQQAPTYRPDLPRFENWERWPMRWIGFFCFGTAVPSVLALIPGLPALIFSTLILLASLMGVAWAFWQPSHRLPAIATILTTLCGLIFSILTLAYHYANPQPTDPNPISQNSLSL